MAGDAFPQPIGVIPAWSKVPGGGVQQRVAQECRISNALHVPGDPDVLHLVYPFDHLIIGGGWELPEH